MTKEGKIGAAYFYYKGKYGSKIIMFRIGNEYQMYLDDARRVSEILDVPLNLSAGDNDIYSVVLPEESILDYMDELSIYGIESKLISYRDDDGNFVIPDVLRLNQEENDDYD